MKSFLLNILNICLVAFILIIIYLLVFDDGQVPEPVLTDLADTQFDQELTKVSIKQLDSLSASSNIYFSKYYTANLLPRE